VRTLVIENPAFQRADIGHALYALPYPNTVPVFDSAAVTAAAAGTPYRYQAHATDPDGVAIAYLLVDGPDGMSVDAATGLVTWAPTADADDTARVLLRAYDTRGGFANQSFTVSVAGGNRAPSLGGLPGDFTLIEGRAFTLPVAVSDADGDPLAVFVQGLPPGASFDLDTRTFTWTPGYGTAGVYRDVRIVASDGQRTVAQSLTLSVQPGNAAPVLCAGVTVYKGLKETDTRPGEWVAISGIGGLGHMAVQYAKAMGLHVLAVDIAEDKLALARASGADLTVNALEEDPGAFAQRMVDGVHGVLVTAVAPKAFEQAFNMMRSKGTMSLVGLPPGLFAIPIFDTVLKRITIRGSIVGTRADLAEALEFAGEGKVKSHYRYEPLDRINAVFDEMRAGEIQGRVVLKMA
jgi:NADPH:quinone reductase-like Zn-dependent oxidoreductase